MEAQEIERLLYDETRLERIREYLSRRGKHIFGIIGRDNDELTFSRLMCHFLDPAETHGAGPAFLRPFLHTLALNSRDADCSDVSRLVLDSIDLRSASVARESSLGALGRADILIEVEAQLLVLVEVKVHSSEGTSQTDRYWSYLEKRLASTDAIALPVFLTPAGDLPENSHFIPVSYAQLLASFRSAPSPDSLGERERLLLQNFLEWMSDMVPPDDDLRRICRAVYSEHKNVFDFIMEHAPTARSLMIDLRDAVSQAGQDTLVAHCGSYWMTASPKQWLKSDLLRESSKYTKIRIELSYNSSDLVLALIGPDNPAWHDRAKSLAEDILDCQARPPETWRSGRSHCVELHRWKEADPESAIGRWEEFVAEVADVVANRACALQQNLLRDDTEPFLVNADG